ncbi:MAG: TonB-dependent receptor [Xanthomonadaceae bacterium]|nr:TonB-dependent receptor [Xanthomonadaceae bacterium]MDP2186584.1 TonB-dependent receptor [Xanthomonadales bacterium]MDZ4117538.1 TonB-dependent receptor [Xanthomonadaceae bacterium]MDZ4377877.1 TonB-dependent receptor [Xanthomonadaceae bacterium]
MTNMKHLPNAIRFALFAGASAAAVGGNAFAQEQAKTLDRVEVTGSRIKRVDTETTSPVTLLTRVDIERTGLTDIRDILDRLTSSDGGGLSTVSTQTNGNDGTQTISLRGLGSSRTLVLVDGHRWATTAGGSVDLTSIPTAIVERIEVLKDGASAIYGSDAIAGVINIITRRNFEGMQFRAQYSETEEGDGAQEQYNLTWGASSERTNVVMNIGFQGRDGIGQGDRARTATPVFGCIDPPVASNPGACGSGSPAGGRFVVPGLGNQSLIPGRPGTSVSDFRPFTSADRFNFSPVNFLQLPGDTRNLFASATHDITDNIRAVAKFNYTKRTSDNRIAQVPLSLATNGSSGPQWAIPITVNNVFNPFGAQIDSGGFRMVAAGGRFNRADVDTYATNVGLEGAFNIGDRGFNWDVGLSYNDTQNDQQQDNLVNLFNLRQALGPSFRDGNNVLRCGTPGAVVAGCTPFNLFGGPDLGVGAGVISAAEQQRMLDFVTHTANSFQGNTSNNYYANLSGDLFNLPGGMVQFAAGYEYRKDDTFDQPDSLIVGGGSSTNFTEPTKGQTIIEEFYGELSLPLLSDMMFAKELNVTLAARNTSFESQGDVGSGFVSTDLGSTTNYSVALRWKPIDDLLIRASWGESFRAPSASDLFSGGGENFPGVSDPCRQRTGNILGFDGLTPDQQARCVALGVPQGGWNQVNAQQRSLVGGNADLTPEGGENVNIGLVYNPSWLPGFDLSVDYWRIRIADALTSFGANFIVNQCITGAGGNGIDSFCSFITRAPVTGEIIDLRTSQFNASSFKTDGIDFNLNYRFETENFGRFSFASETTWVSDLTTQNDFQSVPVQFTGLYTGSPNFEWRSTLVTTWSKGDFDASWTVRFNSELTEEDCGTLLVCNRATFDADGDLIDDENHIGATTYHDVNVGWTAPWKARVSVGVRNLFSKEPPLVSNGFAGSFDAAYDSPQSQTWFVQYRQDF